MWAFALLGGVFIAEFFMGGMFDIMANGTSYFTGLPFVALSGSVLTVLGAGLLDFIVAVGSVTASFWFLAMMGVEMGALVVFKIKYARETETKMRLGLMLAAYAIYAIWLPVLRLLGRPAEHSVDRLEHGDRNRGCDHSRHRSRCPCADLRDLRAASHSSSAPGTSAPCSAPPHRCTRGRPTMR